MPKYRYRAVNGNGQWSRGVMESGTYQQAVEELRGQGLWISELNVRGESILQRDLDELLFGGPKVKTQHFTVFCRQLSTMYVAGVNMVEAIRILSEQTESKPFRKVLAAVSEEMKRGTQFSVAASAFPSVFSNVFVNMIKAGEASGNLDEMLNRLAIFYEKEYYTSQKIKSAMIYPVIMSVVMIAVVSFMMIFVIPKYVENFEAMGLELPLPTRIVMRASELIQGYWYLIPIVLIAPAVLLKSIGKTKNGRYRLDLWKLKLPVFGQLWHKQAIARFARTFSSLFAAAIPMMQAMAIVSNVVGNAAIAKLISESREGIRGGNPMAEPFSRSWLFPPMVVQMMAIGERTGALDTMLEKVADFYEADVDAMADRMKSLLEPLMILAIAGVVGFIVLAILMPTFKLMEGVQ
ncbi:type II secretion system F family protein [Cohnella sp. GCM10027633]|uniref:type II secretion system F family protein n=1 Tax=unclassified Cohnella TaxID=2636738 RepID=UPI003625F9DF